jgi:hypothetical protein
MWRMSRYLISPCPLEFLVGPPLALLFLRIAEMLTLSRDLLISRPISPSVSILSKSEESAASSSKSRELACCLLN